MASNVHNQSIVSAIEAQKTKCLKEENKLLRLQLQRAEEEVEYLRNMLDVTSLESRPMGDRNTVEPVQLGNGGFGNYHSGNINESPLSTSTESLASSSSVDRIKRPFAQQDQLAGKASASLLSGSNVAPSLVDSTVVHIDKNDFEKRTLPSLADSNVTPSLTGSANAQAVPPINKAVPTFNHTSTLQSVKNVENNQTLTNESQLSFDSPANKEQDQSGSKVCENSEGDSIEIVEEALPRLSNTVEFKNCKLLRYKKAEKQPVILGFGTLKFSKLTDKMEMRFVNADNNVVTYSMPLSVKFGPVSGVAGRMWQFKDTQNNESFVLMAMFESVADVGKLDAFVQN